jgi:hypothetical protein
MSFQLTTAKVWNGSAWVDAKGQFLTIADVSSTTGFPTITNYSSGGISYRAYSFTGTGFITFTRPGLVDCLVIGAGGGGGWGNGRGGGGGWAGSYLEETVYVPSGSILARIGAGGAGANGEIPGFWGTQTHFYNYTGYSGGGGGSRASTANTGHPGGSSGGCCGITGNAPFEPLVSVAGFRGGFAGSGFTGDSAGGGGGGAGSVGGNGAFRQGGNGGFGKTSSITGTPVGRAGGGNAASGRSEADYGLAYDGAVQGGPGGTNTGAGGSGIPRTGTAFAGGSGLVVVRVRA